MIPMCSNCSRVTFPVPSVNCWVRLLGTDLTMIGRRSADQGHDSRSPKCFPYHKKWSIIFRQGLV